MLDGAEEIFAVARRKLTDGGASDDEAERMDRVGWVGYQNNVAGRGDRLRHVRKTLFRSEGRDNLRVGIEGHAKAALVIGSLGAAQAGNAFGGRIAMGARLVDRLDQFVDDVLGRGHIRIAHAQIDDVGTARPRRRLEPVYFGKNVRG